MTISSLRNLLILQNRNIDLGPKLRLQENLGAPMSIPTKTFCGRAADVKKGDRFIC
jgi:hypothetical protein